MALLVAQIWPTSNQFQDVYIFANTSYQNIFNFFSAFSPFNIIIITYKTRMGLKYPL